MLAMLWMGGIGFIDDYLKIVEGKSRGLVAKWKLAGQVSFGIVLGTLLLYFPVVPTDTIPRRRHHGAVLQVRHRALPRPAFTWHS